MGRIVFLVAGQDGGERAYRSRLRWQEPMADDRENTEAKRGGTEHARELRERERSDTLRRSLRGSGARSRRGSID